MSTLVSRLLFLFPSEKNKLVPLVHSPDVDLWIIDTQEILECYEKSLSTNIHRQAWWRQSMLVYPLPTLAWRAARRQAQWFSDGKEGILLVCKRELIQRSWFLINSGVIYNRCGLSAQTAQLPPLLSLTHMRTHACTHTCVQVHVHTNRHTHTHTHTVWFCATDKIISQFWKKENLYFSVSLLFCV